MKKKVMLSQEVIDKNHESIINDLASTEPKMLEALLFVLSHGIGSDSYLRLSHLNVTFCFAEVYSSFQYYAFLATANDEFTLFQVGIVGPYVRILKTGTLREILPDLKLAIDSLRNMDIEKCPTNEDELVKPGFLSDPKVCKLLDELFPQSKA
jgi:hypothetical protein